MILEIKKDMNIPFKYKRIKKTNSWRTALEEVIRDSPRELRPLLVLQRLKRTLIANTNAIA